VSCQEQTPKCKDYQKSEEMLTENIVMTKEVVWESTQIGYQNNKSFKKALRWAIEMTKMSKLRILSNDKRGHLRKHSDRLLKW